MGHPASVSCDGTGCELDLTFTLSVYSFSPTLANLHATLQSLRRKSASLQHDLRQRYQSPSLTLKNHLKFGAGAHIKVKDGVALLDVDSAAHAVLRTNSTRLYVMKVRPLASQLASRNHVLISNPCRNGAVSSEKSSARKTRSANTRTRRCKS